MTNFHLTIAGFYLLGQLLPSSFSATTIMVRRSPDLASCVARTFTITLPEVLVHPLRTEDVARATAFRNLLLRTHGVTTALLTVAVAELAARLRADYQLRTPDADQIATALLSDCDSFLTNDVKLKRVTELRVIVVNELTL